METSDNLASDLGLEHHHPILIILEGHGGRLRYIYIYTWYGSHIGKIQEYQENLFNIYKMTKPTIYIHNTERDFFLVTKTYVIHTKKYLLYND